MIDNTRIRDLIREAEDKSRSSGSDYNELAYHRDIAIALRELRDRRANDKEQA